jgi:hypothetical protein
MVKSHCEKLLAAYWVESQLEFALGTTNVSRIHELKGCDLPPHRQRATLYLNHRPCVPCRLFLGAIQRATGIGICVFPQAMIQEISRDSQDKRAATLGGCKNCACEDCQHLHGRTTIDGNGEGAASGTINSAGQVGDN